MFKQLGVPPGARVIVGGSTHDGEETVLTEQLHRLRKIFPDVFLVVWFRAILNSRGKSANGSPLPGIKFAYRSEIVESTHTLPENSMSAGQQHGRTQIFLQHATIVFIGKSLTAKGGQNPIEPAALASRFYSARICQNLRTSSGTSSKLTQPFRFRLKRNSDKPSKRSWPIRLAARNLATMR